MRKRERGGWMMRPQKKPYNDVKFKQLDQKNIHSISLERGDERVEKTA